MSVFSCQFSERVAIMASYRELTVWQKAMDLTTEIYELTKKLPKDEMYALSNQMRRASVSIPSNIAEGQERNTKKEFCSFLYIARGSRAELETQLDMCIRIGYLTNEEISKATSLLKEVGKMLTSLITKLITDN